MTLLARRIAVQGFGGGPLAVALQGFVPVAQPAISTADQSGTAGGGVVTSATISLREWLRLIERRAEEAMNAAPAPVVLPAAVSATSAAAAARKRRRRAEEELLLLIG